MQTFQQLGIHKDFVKGLNELGIVNPTEIQEETIPELLNKNTDFIGQAPTGTGKTAAYGLPILQDIEIENKVIQALILAPTRELAQQIKKQFEHYLDSRQVKELQKNPDKLKLGGEKRYATFLFTDVRGFTALSETLEPEEVTYIMNKALTAQQMAVQAQQAELEQYYAQSEGRSGDKEAAKANALYDMSFIVTCLVLIS